MAKILLIDDDTQLGPPLAIYFHRFEMELDVATRPSAGLAKLRAGHFDAAILDVMLPEMDGFELCRTIRRENDIPIVMLTARGEVMDRVVGLELGADDYLPKPFEPRELVARLQTVLRRRRAGVSGQRLVFDGLELDLDKHTVHRQGALVDLTGTEFALLALLAREPGKVFGRDDILNHLRGHEAELYTRAVDIVVNPTRRAAAEGKLLTHYATPQERSNLMPVFTDRDSFAQSAGLLDTDSAYVLVINRNGDVLARVAGEFDEDKAQALRETLRETLSNSEDF